jgi:hypothetical protein
VRKNDSVQRNEENETPVINSDTFPASDMRDYGKTGKNVWTSTGSGPDLNQVLFKYSRSG